MPDQFFLPGFSAPPISRRPGPHQGPGGTDHLFLGILPAQDAASSIARLCEQKRATHGLRGRRIPEERLHLTLLSLGPCSELPSEIIAATDAVFRNVAAATASFDVRFRCVGSFAGNDRNRPLS